MRFLTPLLLVVLLSGCGYVPSAKFARGILGEHVYVTVEILASEPENAVILKDAINEALISRFRVTLSGPKSATSRLNVGILSLAFIPIEYDSNGYIIGQRAQITLGIKRTRNNKSKSYSVSGSYDYDVEPNGVVSDADRFLAIKSASLRALDALVAKLAVEGVK